MEIDQAFSFFRLRWWLWVWVKILPLLYHLQRICLRFWRIFDQINWCWPWSCCSFFSLWRRWVSSLALNFLVPLKLTSLFKSITKESGQKSDPMVIFPKDLLKLIFSHLTLNDIFHASRASKSWFYYCQEPFIVIFLSNSLIRLISGNDFINNTLPSIPVLLSSLVILEVVITRFLFDEFADKMEAYKKQTNKK